MRARRLVSAVLTRHRSTFALLDVGQGRFAGGPMRPSARAAPCAAVCRTSPPPPPRHRPGGLHGLPGRGPFSPSALASAPSDLSGSKSAQGRGPAPALRSLVAPAPAQPCAAPQRSRALAWGQPGRHLFDAQVPQVLTKPHAQEQDEARHPNPACQKDPPAAPPPLLALPWMPPRTAVPFQWKIWKCSRCPRGQQLSSGAEHQSPAVRR